MNRMNWKIIESNIQEAREQLVQIELLISSKKYPSEGELQVMVEHAYHHLNFAWNTRRIATKQYRRLSDEEFNRWGKYPSDIETFVISEIPEDHPLVGTWITDEEDSDAAFIFTIENGYIEVSGFCRSDGEKFEIRNTKWDGEILTFTARMPSTDYTSINSFQMRPDGRADLTLTIFEVWKKKDVKPGEQPEGWQVAQPAR
jgi:hypothetical protein